VLQYLPITRKSRPLASSRIHILDHTPASSDDKRCQKTHRRNRGIRWIRDRLHTRHPWFRNRELLGGEQSGHLQEIGYSLYTELLERAVNALKSGEEPDLEQPVSHNTEVNLYTTALLPNDYIPDVHTRLILYKRIANAADEHSLDEIQVELIDRFGLLPQPAKALIRTAEIKLKATPLGIRKIDFGSKGGYILFNEKTNVEPQAIINLIQMHPNDYRLAGQDKLNLLIEIADFSERCQLLEGILEQFKS